MGSRITGVVFVALGIGLLTAGLASANGASGACYGTWTEEYDPGTDSWSYVSGSFHCTFEPACPGEDNICLAFVTQELVNGDKLKICACNTGTSWQIDQVYIGHEPTYACSAEAYETGGVVTSVSCNYGCVTGSCQKEITAQYFDGSHYLRDYVCSCQ
jgi:hypothetical protein